MKATIVTVGDEILIGQIIDTNSGIIAKYLDKIGIAVHEMISITDDKSHILKTLKSTQNQVDLVILTGGLGPTKDDITKKTLCEYFDDTLIINQKVLDHVTQMIESLFKRPITQMNKDQSLVPSKCEVLFNAVGTAPGMWMQKENTVFISLPGVPYEMKHIMTTAVLPKLIAQYERPFIVHRTILTYGVGESLLAERIEKLENNLPSFVKLAYLPSPGRVRLRFTARGKEEAVLHNEIKLQIDQLKLLIADCIVGEEEDESIEFVIGKLLKEKKLTIAVAESCTGGKIAARITAIAGSSNYFKGGIVAYNTNVKIDVLGVNKQLIDQFSVVSKEVAEAMAIESKKILKSDFAIATTGNAGPNKGESDAEIGTVVIAIATPKDVFSEEFNFGQPREKVIDRTVNKAFELIYKEILKNY